MGPAADSHLPHGLDASDDAEVHDRPAGGQAGQQPPLHGAAVLNGSCDVQRLPVPEVAHGARGPALLHEPWNQAVPSYTGHRMQAGLRLCSPPSRSHSGGAGHAGRTPVRLGPKDLAQESSSLPLSTVAEHGRQPTSCVVNNRAYVGPGSSSEQTHGAKRTGPETRGFGAVVQARGEASTTTRPCITCAVEVQRAGAPGQRLLEGVEQVPQHPGQHHVVVEADQEGHGEAAQPCRHATITTSHHRRPDA